MKTPLKIVILVALALTVTAAVALKKGKPALDLNGVKPTANAMGAASNAVQAMVATNAPLPKLIDLGATKCIPCKMMAPILEELKKEYAGRMNVEFIDVWENREAGKPYNIEMIPTQIFFDAAGKELFRHQGFFGKEDILAKWQELGVAFAEAK
jgi:thioredoxin 1